MGIDGEAKKQLGQLTGEDWQQLIDLHKRIQSHEGPWGSWGGGEEMKPGVVQMPYAIPDELITEFVKFLYEHELVINFDWSSWQEGRDWYADKDETKYDTLDATTALKLLTAVIRNDRFNEGALMSAFESGDFPRIIKRLIEIHSQG